MFTAHSCSVATQVINAFDVRCIRELVKKMTTGKKKNDVTPPGGVTNLGVSSIQKSIANFIIVVNQLVLHAPINAPRLKEITELYLLRSCMSGAQLDHKFVERVAKDVAAYETGTDGTKLAEQLWPKAESTRKPIGALVLRHRQRIEAYYYAQNPKVVPPKVPAITVPLHAELHASSMAELHADPQASAMAAELTALLEEAGEPVELDMQAAFDCVLAAARDALEARRGSTVPDAGAIGSAPTAQTAIAIAPAATFPPAATSAATDPGQLTGQIPASVALSLPSPPQADTQLDSSGLAIVPAAAALDARPPAAPFLWCIPEGAELGLPPLAPVPVDGILPGAPLAAMDPAVDDGIPLDLIEDLDHGPGIPLEALIEDFLNEPCAESPVARGDSQRGSQHSSQRSSHASMASRLIAAVAQVAGASAGVAVTASARRSMDDQFARVATRDDVAGARAAAEAGTADLAALVTSESRLCRETTERVGEQGRQATMEGVLALQQRLNADTAEATARRRRADDEAMARRRRAEDEEAARRRRTEDEEAARRLRDQQVADQRHHAIASGLASITGSVPPACAAGLLHEPLVPTPVAPPMEVPMAPSMEVPVEAPVEVPMEAPKQSTKRSGVDVFTADRAVANHVERLRSAASKRPKPAASGSTLEDVWGATAQRVPASSLKPGSVNSRAI